MGCIAASIEAGNAGLAERRCEDCCAVSEESWFALGETQQAGAESGKIK
jgi:hypothetical protein